MPYRCPEQRRKGVIKRKARYRRFINSVKDVPCQDCGVKYPYYVMQFDHVTDDKCHDISKMCNHSLDTVRAEIDKCEVVCANCHAERTFQRGYINGSSEVQDMSEETFWDVQLDLF